MRNPKEKEPSKGGMPRFVPTDNERALVKLLIANGYAQHLICQYVGNHRGSHISESTLKRAFARKLELGPTELAVSPAGGKCCGHRPKNFRCTVRDAAMGLRLPGPPGPAAGGTSMSIGAPVVPLRYGWPLSLPSVTSVGRKKVKARLLCSLPSMLSDFYQSISMVLVWCSIRPMQTFVSKCPVFLRRW
jgi:hypothetical protein